MDQMMGNASDHQYFRSYVDNIQKDQGCFCLYPIRAFRCFTQAQKISKKSKGTEGTRVCHIKTNPSTIILDWSHCNAEP